MQTNITTILCASNAAGFVAPIGHNAPDKTKDKTKGRCVTSVLVRIANAQASESSKEVNESKIAIAELFTREQRILR